MCGICGRLSWETPPDVALVQRMNDRIAHRGPDAQRVQAIGPVAFGHRRLAIIDLSPLGEQPMSDTSGQYWIIFNGEIYNFLEIRPELEKLGARFRSNSDTEVMLEAYKHWGVECLKRFNGMFAFALWDAPQQRLFVARDRLGKKPMYYQILPDGGISFASELKALALDPAVSNRINPLALSHYLSLNYTLTGDAILQGVKKLPAAHYMVVQRGKPAEPIRYWDVAQAFHNKARYRSETEAGEALTALMDDAVRLRLISDVPLGVFLSGGVDSSTVVAAMCQFKDPKDVHSFSVGFQERGYSELDEAREVAGLFGVTHSESVVLPDVEALMPIVAWHGDEPFADTSMIPTYLLAEYCRKAVTVCLSGDGGDEVFAGYETYAADTIHHMTRWIPGWMSRMIGRAVERWVPATYDKVSFDYKLRQFLEGQPMDGTRAHYHWRTIFSDEEKKALLKSPLRETICADPFERFSAHQREVADCHYLDQGMYVDLKTWLVDDILVKVDRMTMAHALEPRAPFLDHRLVEFAASLPVDLKMRFFEKKYLLRKSQRGRIHPSILNRRKKGFNAPMAHWLASSLKDKYFELTTRSEAAREMFEEGYVKRLWEEHEQRRSDHSLKLLGLINLLLWKELYGAEMP